MTANDCFEHHVDLGKGLLHRVDECCFRNCCCRCYLRSHCLHLYLYCHCLTICIIVTADDWPPSGTTCTTWQTAVQMILLACKSSASRACCLPAVTMQDYRNLIVCHVVAPLSLHCVHAQQMFCGKNGCKVQLGFCSQVAATAGSSVRQKSVQFC